MKGSKPEGPYSLTLRRDKEESTELSALLFSQEGILGGTFSINNRRGEIDEDGGEFVRSADGVGGDDVFPKYFEEFDIKSGRIFVIPLLDCGKCRVGKGGYRGGGSRRFGGRRGWRGGGWGGCRLRLRQGYGVIRKEGSELSALLFSRGGIFCCTFLIGAEGVEVVVEGGNFGEGSGAVGGDEGVAEVLKDGDVVGSG